MGDRSADHLLDPGVLERRDAFPGELQPRQQPLDLRRRQVEREIPVDAVEAIRLRALGFVRADDQAVVLLAVVARRPRIAHHRQLRGERGDFRDRLGDDVLVDHVGDGHVEPDHRPELRAVAAGGVDHVLGDDPALLRDDLPAAVGELVHVEHAVVAGDLGAEPAGAGRHCVGGGRWIGPPVAGRVKPHGDAVEIQQGMQLGDLARSDEVGLDADELQDAVDVAEPIDFVRGPRQSHCSASVPARVQAGLRFELLIELRGVGVHLGGVETPDEVGDQSGGVPRRA